MCYNLESTFSRQNLFLDLLIPAKILFPQTSTQKHKREKRQASKKPFSCFFFCPLYLSLQPRVDSEGFYGR